jgi:hypothetical protein
LRACCYCYTGIVDPVVDSPPALRDALDATNRDMNPTIASEKPMKPTVDEEFAVVESHDHVTAPWYNGSTPDVRPEVEIEDLMPRCHAITDGEPFAGESRTLSVDTFSRYV